MEIFFNCPICKAYLRLPHELNARLGDVVVCPECKKDINVPQDFPSPEQSQDKISLGSINYLSTDGSSSTINKDISQSQAYMPRKDEFGVASFRMKLYEACSERRIVLKIHWFLAILAGLIVMITFNYQFALLVFLGYLFVGTSISNFISNLLTRSVKYYLHSEEIEKYELAVSNFQKQEYVRVNAKREEELKHQKNEHDRQIEYLTTSAPDEEVIAFFQNGNRSRDVYKRYLLTSHWKNVKEEVIAKAGNKCQLCSNHDLLNVHHNNYKCIGKETPQDLIVICRKCHKRFHNIKIRSFRH